MAISDDKGKINFRYLFADGPAEKSYGIQVAKLAGLPPRVIQYAETLLQKFEMSGGGDQLDLWQAAVAHAPQMDEVIKPEVDPKAQALKDSLKNMEVQSLTPLEALNKISQWQQDFL